MTARRLPALLVLLALAVLSLPGAALRAERDPSLERRLARLARLGTIVYVTAHPDDESAGIITYLARGLHARIVILCLTRGGGGQNQVGPELNEELGALRTRELEQAAAGYGAEVRFLGAEDFGYSKSAEETLQKWNENRLIFRLVRQIRELRPLAVISHWSGTPRDGGNAHHQVAGLLTRRAFVLAGDPTAFPEQLVHGLPPWQPRYLLVRSYSSEYGDFPVPVRQPSPVPGKTYEDLALEAFRHHRSQGLDDITLERLQRFIGNYYLQVAATVRGGPPPPTSVAELSPDLAALPELFPTVGFLSERRERLRQLAGRAETARRLHGDKPADAARALVEGATLLAALRRELPPAPDVETGMVAALLADRQHEFLAAAARLASVRLEAATDRAVVTPRERVWVRLAVKVGHPGVFRAVGFKVGSLRLLLPGEWPLQPVAADTTSTEKRAEFHVWIPEDVALEQPPPLRAHAELTTGPLTLELIEPVRGLAGAEAKHRGLLERLDPRRWLREKFGEEKDAAGALTVQPVTLAPAITLDMQPELRLVRRSSGVRTYDLGVRVRSHSPYSRTTIVSLEVPAGWPAPEPQELDLPGITSATARFSLTVPAKTPPGRYAVKALARQGERVYRFTRRPHLGATGDLLYAFELARTRLEVIDLDVPNGLRLGYVGFNHDPVPTLLAQLGVTVDMLDPEALAPPQAEQPTRPLDLYDAILIATRAYDYREDLKQQTGRLLAYARRGGTLIVEHQGRSWDPAEHAPFPGRKPPNRNLRVTNPRAPVTLLDPDHPVLTFPNRIGPHDWQGWVQERGLYFWESWSEEYTPLVELADPGSEPLRGALLYAPTGEGAYIYCGLGLFRQVRAGVPGGVRLYLNLLSQSRAGASRGGSDTP